jgi:hypothetical protein
LPGTCVSTRSERFKSRGIAFIRKALNQTLVSQSLELMDRNQLADMLQHTIDSGVRLLWMGDAPL